MKAFSVSAISQTRSSWVDRAEEHHEQRPQHPVGLSTVVPTRNSQHFSP